jgi:hypothetical protein
MSWGAQSRSKDAKTPSVGPAMSENPELDLRPVQPYPYDENDTEAPSPIQSAGLTDGDLSLAGLTEGGNRMVRFCRNTGGALVNVGLYIVLTHVFVGMTEDPAWTFIDPAYFSVTTVTTVGHGDISPTTQGGRWYTFFAAPIGVVLIGMYGLDRRMCAATPVCSLLRPAHLCQLAHRQYVAAIAMNTRPLRGLSGSWAVLF